MKGQGVIRRSVLVAVALLGLGRVQAANVKTEFDWCTVETPESVEADKGYWVKVTLKKTLPEGQNLSVHMQHTKADGSWGGLFEWRPAQNPKPIGEATIFAFTAKAKENLGQLVPVVFAAPNGTWEKKGWTAWPAKIKVSAGGTAAPSASASGASAAPSGMQKTEFDWCTVETPGSVEVGKGYWVKVTLKKALPEGQNLSVHMQHTKADGSWGGLFEWRPAQTPKPVGEATIFAFTAKAKENLGQLVPVVFAAPNGTWEKKGWTAWPAKIKVSAGTAPAAKPSALVEYQKTEFDWCTVESPKSVSSGQGYQVRVTLKKPLPDGQNLSVHAHCVKKPNAWGGLYEWRPAQEPKAVGQTSVFTFTAKNSPAVAKIVPVVFAAPGGDWNKKGLNAWPPQIPLTVSAADQVAAAARERPKSVTFKKSWLKFLPLDVQQVRSGEKFTLKVQYHLDANENWGDGTQLMMDPLGPWIDNPDGVVNKSSQHIFIYGLWRQTRKVSPGEGIVEFVCEPGKNSFGERNQVAFRAKFVGGDGKEWPWEIRTGGPELVPDTKDFRLQAEAVGGVYTYDETPVVNLHWGTIDAPKTVKDVDFTVYDCESNEVACFTRRLTVGAPGTSVKIPLPKLNRRGTMLLEALMTDKNGNDVRHAAAFATIPNLGKVLGGTRPPLACTNIRNPRQAQIAAKLGFGYCRLFTGWADLNPRRGVYTMEPLLKTLDSLNAEGIRPWVLLTGAPEWAMPDDVHAPGYCPFPFDEKGWEESIRQIASACKGKVWGFEWLNEISQGDKTKHPVEDYVKFCRIGTKVLREVDPAARVQMAGGLWPRSYRLDVIRGGVLDAIDVLPVHYGSYGSVAEAIRDAKAGGCEEVWDNESARGISVWKMSPLEQLYCSVTQCSYLLRQWPGEFVAGAKAVTYFGGEANAPGNWTYLLDDYTPRPVLATLAVFASKLGGSTPVGAAYLSPGAIVYLFRRTDGKGLAYVMSESEGCEKPSHYSASAQILAAEPVNVSLPVGGSAAVRVTDYQGNERRAKTEGGFLRIAAKPIPVIVEGFDLEPLAATCSLSIGGQDALTPKPSVRCVSGAAARVDVRVRNPLSTALAGSVSVSLGGKSLAAQKIALKSGESQFLTFDAGKLGSRVKSGKVLMTWKNPSVSYEREFTLETVRPDLLGNLLTNGDFADGKMGWNFNGRAALKNIAATKGVKASDPGMDGEALAFENAKGYMSVNQQIALPAPGREYLYTAWVWPDMMYCGSNLGVTKKDGSYKESHMLGVFTAPKTAKGWVLLSKRRATEPDDVKATFSPVGTGRPGPDGKSLALYRNIRVTVYDGTDFAAEADQVKEPIAVDGDLSDWEEATCTIPLLCENQVKPGANYKWTPQNLSGVAYFAWDKDSLYFAARVKDNSHVVRKDGDANKGDAITLALHPGNRVPGTDGRAVEWYLSTAHPGSGSGKYTLYRPGAHSGGLKSGQLAKDSSNYEIAIRQDGDVCTYELRIPWSEIPGFSPELGARLGLSLRLTDLDEDGSFGEINWGMGLSPAWAPSAFGVLTLIQ